MKGRGLAIYAIGAYAFLHVPLLILAVFSFNSSRFAVWQGFSLQWYRAVADDSNLQRLGKHRRRYELPLRCQSR